ATSSGFGQPSAPRRASAPRTATGAPTAASLAYPQSVFVDSQHGNVWVTDFDNNRVLRFDVLSLTGIARGAVPGAAETYGLAQNYPNPFNPGTTITFALQSTEHATVKIYNVLGQEVVTLFDRLATAHTLYALWFDATNRPSGTYFYVLRSAGRLDVKKMCFVK
ncbi:MAG TPA: T9SS type A sorting domain-containing protein, partial [Bacteroidota bacterium]|nr:T9SS type A sorting domain-containing protein [Bacteroidota bacterium]